MAQTAIAVIDDDESVAHATGTLIRSFGFAVGVYTSAQEFLLSTSQLRPACLVLDVQMPGMSGLQLQDHLASAGKRIPIIFFTGYADERARAQALRKGAVDFLQKPLSERVLLQGIHCALKLNREDNGGIDSCRDDCTTVQDLDMGFPKAEHD